MLPQNRLTAATTTRTPTIVGYQRSRSLIPASVASTRNLTYLLPSQVPLVADDRVDLVLGQDVPEVRHAAGRDAAHAVALVLLDPVGDPVVLRLEAGRRRVVGGQARE